MKTLVIIVLGAAVVAILTRPLRKRVAQERFERFLTSLADLRQRGDHEKIVKAKRPLMMRLYRESVPQARRFVEIRVESLEALGKLEDAVLELAFFLAFTYKIDTWPPALLAKWVSLYKAAGPIAIDKFHCCERCGLSQYQKALIEYAIQQGAAAPAGYPGFVTREVGGERLRIDGRGN